MVTVSFPDEGAGFPSRDTWAFPLRGLLLCFIHHQATFFFCFYLPRGGVGTLRSTFGQKKHNRRDSGVALCGAPRKTFSASWVGTE